MVSKMTINVNWNIGVVVPHYDRNFKESFFIVLPFVVLCWSLRGKIQYFLSRGDSIFTVTFLVWPLNVHGNRYSAPGQSGDERREWELNSEKIPCKTEAEKEIIISHKELRTYSCLWKIPQNPNKPSSVHLIDF